MPKGISLMAVVHVVLIVYIALGLGMQIKLRYKMGYGLEDGPTSLARTVRDYAPVLFVFPVSWAVFSLRRWKRNGTDLDESGTMMVTGLAVVAALLLIAFLGTLSVWLPGSLIQSVPPKTERS